MVRFISLTLLALFLTYDVFANQRVHQSLCAAYGIALGRRSPGHEVQLLEAYRAAYYRNVDLYTPKYVEDFPKKRVTFERRPESTSFHHDIWTRESLEFKFSAEGALVIREGSAQSYQMTAAYFFERSATAHYNLGHIDEAMALYGRAAKLLDELFVGNLRRDLAPKLTELYELAGNLGRAQAVYAAVGDYTSVQRLSEQMRDSHSWTKAPKLDVPSPGQSRPWIETAPSPKTVAEALKILDLPLDAKAHLIRARELELFEKYLPSSESNIDLSTPEKLEFVGPIVRLVEALQILKQAKRTI